MSLERTYPMDTRQEIIYSQPQIDNYISILTDKIKDAKRPYSCVVGIKNGGIHISRPISEALCLPHIGVRISYYDGKRRRRTPICKKGKFKLNDYSSCLIIDDLIDGGGTLNMFEEMYGLRYQDDVAVLFWNRAGDFVPDFWVAEKPDGWIRFPWE